MLLFVICNSIKCFAVDRVYCDYKIVLSLLKMLTPGGSLNWSSQQQCKLNLVVLTTLNVLVELLPGEMNLYQVPSK